ncbi:hypothetical protein D3C81_1958460 [compost metagenome]
MQGGVAQVLQLRGIGHVGDLGEHLYALFAQLRRQAFERLPVAVGEDQVQSLDNGPFGQAAADAAGCAGDHRDAVLW